MLKWTINTCPGEARMICEANRGPEDRPKAVRAIARLGFGQAEGEAFLQGEALP